MLFEESVVEETVIEEYEELEEELLPLIELLLLTELELELVFV